MLCTYRVGVVARESESSSSAAEAAAVSIRRSLELDTTSELAAHKGVRMESLRHKCLFKT